MTGKIGEWIETHKKFASGAGLVLAIALIFSFIYSPRVVGAAATTRVLPIYSVEREGKYVSLSFDAAWADV